MSGRDAPPPYFGDYPDGAYWSAKVSDHDDEEESYEVSGTTIRFMPDDTVTVPLWDDEGLLPEDPDWLHRALGLSAQLAAEIAAWGDEWNAAGAGGKRFSRKEHRERQVRLRAQAESLVDRIRAEVPPDFTVLLESEAI